ncbi:unnamed protein product [Vicia faba]|uniref:Uncharacterized protein n=1 Tax=Vicia faba TaxID=3906 RepID=A0AAV1AT18_VICFA|nr:unnamed protein product [Vicia faba]
MHCSRSNSSKFDDRDNIQRKKPRTRIPKLRPWSVKPNYLEEEEGSEEKSRVESQEKKVQRRNTESSHGRKKVQRRNRESPVVERGLNLSLMQCPTILVCLLLTSPWQPRRIRKINFIIKHDQNLHVYSLFLLNLQILESQGQRMRTSK